jgi:hypothetical protein
MAVILLLIGLAIPTQVGSVAITALAALVAIVPVIAGTPMLRIAAIVIALAAVGIAASNYQSADQEMQAYRAHAKSR